MTKPIRIDLKDSDYTKLFQKSGKVYRKIEKPVSARLSKSLERVPTTLQNGFSETTNIARPGDWIVTGLLGEEYILKPRTFGQRFTPIKGQPGLYLPCGLTLIVRNPTGLPVVITAPWGNDMHGDEECFFGAVITNNNGGRPVISPTDRYIIGQPEMETSYEKLAQ